MKQPVHESAEDYLKAVLALEREHGYVRAVDVAGRLGVSKASVSKALSKLERQKLVHVVAHDVRLTAEGRAVAERVSERHAFFRALLRAAGVEAVVADEEACRLEHCLCEDSFRKLVTALDVGLLRRNGARRGKVAFVVEGDRPAGGEDCRVEIDGGDLAGLRLAEVLRAKLGVSRSGLERLVEAGDVSAADGADVLAAKLRPHQTILVRGRREQ